MSDKPIEVKNIDDALLFTKMILVKKFPAIKNELEAEFTEAERQLYASQAQDYALSHEAHNQDEEDLPF